MNTAPAMSSVVGCGFVCGGGGAKWFHERHAAILADERKTNAIVAERTKLTLRQLSIFSETEQQKDANEAVDDGIAHRISNVDIPDDAYVYTVPVE